MHKASGFTLVELVIVMIIVSVGLLGLISLFGNTAKTLTINETLQRATQYAQECAERAIEARRQDFAGMGSFSCGADPADFTFNAVGRPTVIGALYNGTGNPCPTGTLNCRNIAVNVTSTADTSLYASVTVMLVKY